MGTITAITSVLLVVIGALGVYIRLRGSGKEKFKQAEDANEALSNDAKKDAKPDLRGDDLRDAWHNELRKKDK